MTTDNENYSSAQLKLKNDLLNKVVTCTVVSELLTMLKDTQQETLVRDGIPPQGWELRVVRVWHPDLNLTEEDKNGVQTDHVWTHPCS